MPVSSKARKLNEAKMYIKKVNRTVVIRQKLCLLKVTVVTYKKLFVPSGSFLLGRKIWIFLQIPESFVFLVTWE